MYPILGEQVFMLIDELGMQLYDREMIGMSLTVSIGEQGHNI
jgi:hypothetical protein